MPAACKEKLPLSIYRFLGLQSQVVDGENSGLTALALLWPIFMSSPPPYSHAVALTRDSERLSEVKKRINVLPLGR